MYEGDSIRESQRLDLRVRAVDSRRDGVDSRGQIGTRGDSHLHVPFLEHTVLVDLECRLTLANEVVVGDGKCVPIRQILCADEQYAASVDFIVDAVHRKAITIDEVPSSQIIVVKPLTGTKL